MDHYGGWHLSSWPTAAMFRLRGPRTCGPSGCFLSKSLLTASHSVTFQTKRLSRLPSATGHYPLVQNMLIRGGSVMRCGISWINAGNVIPNPVLQCQTFVKPFRTYIRCVHVRDILTQLCWLFLTTRKPLGPAGLPCQILYQEVRTSPLFIALQVHRVALVHQVSPCQGHLDRLA
jgi:hypothetical protein